MATYLHFREHRAPAPRELVRRLRRAFKHVRASRNIGCQMVDESIRYLTRLKRKGTLAAAEANQQIDQLRLNRGGALWVQIADTATDKVRFLQALFVRGESLFFGYSSIEHERAAAPLLTRCAKVLNCEISNEPRDPDDS